MSPPPANDRDAQPGPRPSEAVFEAAKAIARWMAAEDARAAQHTQDPRP